MASRKIVAAALACALTSACAGGPGGGGGVGFDYFRLVQAKPDSVANKSMTVTPGVPWNRIPRQRYDIDREENWTLNGPLLDGLTFIGGLENGKRIVVQRKKADRLVPNFRADMSPQDIAAMIESFYRIRAGSAEFNMTGLQPRTFVGHPGFQFDYEHLGGDEVRRQGRAVGAVVNGRFYLALFDAAKMHYFPTGIPEFERIANSARLGG